ncbi:MAG TPA: hypothetical protein VLE73_05450 [Candidatus Saccharimonadales bacterium]|nr:hypothetical protein [Candidatus Saccharimonadales bacterium]
MGAFSAEDINAAWYNADLANNAFDWLRKAERAIAALRIVASLAVRGIRIEQIAFDELEKRRINEEQAFQHYCDLAAPIMSAPNSPFAITKEIEPAISEQQFATDQTFRGLPELRSFERLRNHKINVGRIWNILCENADITLVSDLDQYDPPYDEAALAEQQHVQMIALEHPDVTIDPELTQRFDVHSLYTRVRAWQLEKPNIAGLGVKNINFLADYVNHALPQYDKLPAYLFREPVPAQLLDAVTLGSGEVVEVVSQFALHRFTRTLRPRPNPPHFVTFFESIARTLAPNFTGRPPEATKVTDDLIYIGTYPDPRTGIRTAWGMPPDRFTVYMNGIDTTFLDQEEMQGHGAVMHSVITQYLQSLNTPESDG